MPISINKNSESGARIHYATFFNIRQCQTDESLAGGIQFPMVLILEFIETFLGDGI